MSTSPLKKLNTNDSNYFKNLTIESNEQEFGLVHQKTIKLINTCIGIVILLYDIFFIAYYFYESRAHFANLAVNIFVFLIDILSFIILLNTRPLTKYNKLGSYLRIFFFIRGVFAIIYYPSIKSDLISKKNTFLTLFYTKLLISVCSKIANIYSTNVEIIIKYMIFLAAILISWHLAGDSFINYLAEVVFLVASLIILIFKNMFLNSLFYAYNEKMKIEEMITYYRSFIDDLRLQQVSFVNKKCISYNEGFYEKFNSFCSNLNLEDYDSHKPKERVNKNISLYFDKFILTTDNLINLKDLVNGFAESKENSSLKFTNLGIFTNKEKSSYITVCIRKYSLLRCKETIVDIVFEEITKIIEAQTLSVETGIKQKLFSKLAHEFKTPLFVVKNMAKDIGENCKCSTSNEIKNTCEVVSAVSDYITFLISDIIYYTNNQNLEFTANEEVDLQEVLLFSVSITKAISAVLYGKDNISITCSISESLKYIRVISNKIRLQQVLLNFASNSAKFTRSVVIIFQQISRMKL